MHHLLMYKQVNRKFQGANPSHLDFVDALTVNFVGAKTLDYSQYKASYRVIIQLGKRSSHSDDYIPSTINVHPNAIAAQQPNPSQLALGLLDGGVYKVYRRTPTAKKPTLDATRNGNTSKRVILMNKYFIFGMKMLRILMTIVNDLMYVNAIIDDKLTQNTINVHPNAIAAQQPNPSQLALGLLDGGVYVIELLE
nr:hypothetical protein [Tanacetum cinerariifolium]